MEPDTYVLQVQFVIDPFRENDAKYIEWQDRELKQKIFERLSEITDLKLTYQYQLHREENIHQLFGDKFRTITYRLYYRKLT